MSKREDYLSKREKIELGLTGHLLLLSDGQILDEATGKTLELDNWQRWKLKSLRNKDLATAFWASSVQKA